MDQISLSRGKAGFMRNSVEGRMQSIVADIFAIPKERITVDSSPDTIETWDSLQHLNLVLAVEQDFGVQFGPGLQQTHKPLQACKA